MTSLIRVMSCRAVKVINNLQITDVPYRRRRNDVTKRRAPTFATCLKVADNFSICCRFLRGQLLCRRTSKSQRTCSRIGGRRSFVGGFHTCGCYGLHVQLLTAAAAAVSASFGCDTAKRH